MPVKRQKNIEHLSLSTRGARHQIGISIALITIIPLLALIYALFFLGGQRESGLLVYIVLSGSAVSILLGYAVLCRYPLNVSRLRRRLENIVQGRFDEDVGLLKGMADVPAIEHALQMLVEQLRRRVERVESEIGRAESLLSRSARSAFEQHHDGTLAKQVFHRADLASDDTLIMNCLGPDVLAGLVSDFLDLAESAAAVFEKSGSLAIGVAASPWHKALCFDGPRVFEGDGGGDDDYAISWRSAALSCMAHETTIDTMCKDGLRLCLSPIRARGQIVGVSGFSYGKPPTDPARVDEISAAYGALAQPLQQLAESHDAHPPVITSLAKNRLVMVAMLIGEMIERRLAEFDLRRQQDKLEDIVKERTEELENMNELLKEEVEERRRAEALKDEFVSTVSHELRTPLAITKEGIGLLIDGIPGDINAKQTKVLKTAGGNIDRLSRIINDLLDISKIEAGKIDMHKENVNFIDVAESVATSVKPLASQKGLALETSYALETSQVFADGDRIIQVLTNLLSNAIKFTDKGHIRLAVIDHNGQLECAVEDTGVGLTREDTDRVFERFVQIGRTHGAGDKGTGLGLAIAREIINLHRGRIWAESTLGKGSRFTFTLPFYSEDEVIREMIEETMAESRLTHESFILLLFDIIPDVTEIAGNLEQMFAQGVRNLQELQNLVRASDRMMLRGDSQVVMIAKVDVSQLAGLYRRWEAQVSLCFHNVDPQFDVRLHCGFAEYPNAGSSANELMSRAERTMSPFEKLDITQGISAGLMSPKR